MKSKLNWRTDFENLKEGDSILTKMKHGIISGTWDSESKTCGGYYWQDMEWYPHSFVLLEDIE